MILPTLKLTAGSADPEPMEPRELLGALVDAGASDMHCKPGSVLVMRKDGELVRHGDTTFTAEDIAAHVQSMLSSDQQSELIRTGSVVGAHSEPGVGRFRIAAYRQRNSVAMVVHRVADDVPKIGELGLPDAVATLAGTTRGLVLVASPVGNGATTTLAAMVDHLNSTQRRHVVSVEDPIELLHRDGTGIVSQFEVGADVASCGEGIRAASRVDADVIAVSEIADRESAAAVLDAVARGRSVLAGIAGYSVESAVHSFLELFTVDERDVARAAFSRSLAGIVAQRLLPTTDGGRTPAVELLVQTSKTEQCIAEPGRLDDLRVLLEEGQYHGMQTMDQDLVRLVRAGLVEADLALGLATDPEDMRIELLR